MENAPPRAPLDDAPGRGAKNIGFLVGALVIVGAIVTLAMTSFDEQIYYYTVAEAQAKASEIGQREFRIKGNVVAGSLALREGVLNEHRFELIADAEVIEVHYNGPLPDTFSDDAEVIALGRFADGGRFVATEVIAKCPSRYEEAPPTAQSQQS